MFFLCDVLGKISRYLSYMDLIHLFELEFPIWKNILLERVFGVTDWKGDILIVKHPCDDLDCVTHIEYHDRALVDLIVRLYVLKTQSS